LRQRKGAAAPPRHRPTTLVLQAVGRSPNGNKIAADKAGVAVMDRGFINVDARVLTMFWHAQGVPYSGSYD
jgi:dihydrolipoamide dehydrogenase